MRIFVLKYKEVEIAKHIIYLLYINKIKYTINISKNIRYWYNL